MIKYTLNGKTYSLSEIIKKAKKEGKQVSDYELKVGNVDVFKGNVEKIAKQQKAELQAKDSKIAELEAKLAELQGDKKSVVISGQEIAISELRKMKAKELRELADKAGIETDDKLKDDVLNALIAL